MYITILILLITLSYPLWADIRKWVSRGIHKNKWKEDAGIFDHSYLEGKSFYMYRFKEVPGIKSIDDVDVAVAIHHIEINYGSRILDVYQRSYFNRDEGVQQCIRTLIVLDNHVIVKLSGEYVEILHRGSEFEFADKLLSELVEFKAPEKKKDFEINIISFNNNGLELKALDIKPTELDIDLYYNEDFGPVDRVISERLAKDNDKGIILLHGLPGTGKTTYLRNLVGRMNKKVLFVAPSVAGNLMNPEFIDLLIDNPNAVLVIEDAENIIMDRKFNNNSSVSNLLNLSDGLLSDCLNVQIICTFNNDLSLVDSALMRKGRLIARYEFGKLLEDKAQRLSDHLGLKQIIKKPMTLAEVTNPDEIEYILPQRNAIGFQRVSVQN